MKKTLILAAIVALAACGEKKETGAATDSAATVAPAPADSSATMSHDTTAKADTAMARDTSKKM